MTEPKTRIFVKPKTKELKVRNPATGKHLIKTGEWVENNVYWLRRIKEGDAVIDTPPKQNKTKTTIKD